MSLDASHFVIERPRVLREDILEKLSVWAKIIPSRAAISRVFLPIALFLAAFGASGIPAVVRKPPSNDNFANAIQIVGTNTVVTGSNVDATVEPAEPQLEGGPDNASVWWVWTAPQSGYVTLSTDGSQNSAGGELDTLLGVYTGDSLAALTEIAANDDNPNTFTNRTSWVLFQTSAGVTYHIVVGSFSFDGTNFDTGSITLTLNESPPPPPPPPTPPNDLFANAIEIAGTNVVATGTNLRATVEPNEPQIIAGTADGASVWWDWTAPTGGYVTVSTAGSTSIFGAQLDTQLGVYFGDSLETLTEIASNDDDPNSSTNVTSWLVFQTASGVTYHIAVAGLSFSDNDPLGTNADMGNIILTLNVSSTPTPPPPPPPGTTPPPNDNFANAIQISGTNAVVTGTNVGATLEPGEPNIADTPGGASVWWSWTAPANIYVTISTAGSISQDTGDVMDTVLGVFTGSAVSALTEIASDDDDPSRPGLTTSAVQFQAVAGTTYYIAVDGFATLGGSPDTGSISLELTTSDGPPPLRAAPGWNLPSIQSGMIDSRSFAGQVIVLNFWATWCGPCVDEIPGLVQLSRDYRPKGVTVVGISIDDAINNSAPALMLRDFASANSMAYPIVMTRPSWQSTEGSYGNIAYPADGNISSIPTTFIIDRQNQIRQIVSGEHSYAQFESYIKPLLATNVLSTLELQASVVNGQLKLSWPAEWSNVSVQFKSSLGAAGWSAFNYFVQVEGTNRVMLAPLSQVGQYFRLSSQ